MGDGETKPAVHSYDLPGDRRVRPYRGVLFSFEGVDGGGKSTQYRRAADYLGTRYELTQGREPGGTRISERIRDVLLSVSADRDGGEEMGPETELLLFEASRAQLVSARIKPALERGDVVILDRFYDSSTAYQGGAGGIDLSLVLLANRIASQGIRPDRTYVFDVRPEVALRRMAGGIIDRMEQKKAEYHKRVRESYQGIALLEPERVKIIDTSDIDPDQTFEILKQDIDSYLERHNLDRTLRRKGA